MVIQKANTLGGVAVDDDTTTEHAERSLSLLTEKGVEVEMGWDRNAPYLDEYGLVQRKFHFLDHMYQLTYPDKKIVYGCEPYGLGTEDIQELARLSTRGWDVWIGQSPLWYPGRTTQILISRQIKEEKSDRNSAEAFPTWEDQP